MTDWLKYPIRPLQHGMETDYVSLYTPLGFSPGALNLKVDQHSMKKPWGYAQDRDIGTAVKVYNVVLYQLKDGTRHTIYLTGTDACLKKTGAGETFSYITDTYTTGTATLTGGVTVTGTTTDWATAGIAAGDKFIFDNDHSPNVEPDTHWATVGSRTGEVITLSSAYAGSETTGTYKIRKVYSVPANERWWHAAVNDILCFGNGNINVQYWTGTGYATDLDAVYATRARHGMEYANRLWLANLYDAGIQNPYLLRGSKEGDPTNWDDSTAVDYPFIETDDVVTGLGKVGNQIILFKKESLLIGARSGQPTDPLAFDIQIKGTGAMASNSILHMQGTCSFLGRDDFYIIDAGYPKAVGEKIRYNFFDVVDKTEAENVWGFVNQWQHECIWFANCTGGQYAFVWDYKTNEWYLYQFPVLITGAGTGAI